MTDTRHPQVVLAPRKAAPFWGRHPWVRETSVHRVEGNPADGEPVDLLCDKGKWIARGIYNSQSRIRVRLYTWDAAVTLDDDFWRKRIAAAIELRRRLGYLDPNEACRLVGSEGDGLSGLIVDRYGSHLVIQPTALAIACRIDAITAMLKELAHAETTSLRADVAITRLEGFEVTPEEEEGPQDELIFIEEHGLRYGLQLAEGHKTGFYLDQRENRLASAKLLPANSRVLDVCCYSGGFSLAAAAIGKAREVIGIDVGKKAIALAQANAELNGLSQCRFQQGDCFDTMTHMIAQGEKFDAVVLDPPKFAQRRGTLEEALRAYHRLNRSAVELLQPGGILTTCSCTGNVSVAEFQKMLFGVSLKTGREIQIIERRGASGDHPVSLACGEGEYLKCFLCRVM